MRATGGEAKHRLTLAQLTYYDDILTDALIDHVCSSVGISMDDSD
jgi:hypothetical protein